MRIVPPSVLLHPVAPSPAPFVLAQDGTEKKKAGRQYCPAAAQKTALIRFHRKETQ
jgi:hypothetical protein